MDLRWSKNEQCEVTVIVCTTFRHPIRLRNVDTCPTSIASSRKLIEKEPEATKAFVSVSHSPPQSFSSAYCDADE